MNWEEVLGGTGVDQLINEICEICTRVEPDVKASSVMRRLQFLGYELTALIESTHSTPQRFETLNHFFFDLKEFAVPNEPSFHDPLSLHLLNRVLNTRIGASRTLAMVYRFLGEQIGLKFEFVDLQPNCYLKHVESGLSKFVDFSRRGQSLTSDELLKTLQSRAQTKTEVSTLCESVGADHFVVEYLMVLKSAYQDRSNVEPLLMVQNWILEYQPSNMIVIGERAVLLNQLGHYRNAFADLKRYFSFADRGAAPRELVVLFEDLGRKLAPKIAEPVLN